MRLAELRRILLIELKEEVVQAALIGVHALVSRPRSNRFYNVSGGQHTQTSQFTVHSNLKSTHFTKDLLLEQFKCDLCSDTFEDPAWLLI